MNEQNKELFASSAERLAAAADALEKVLARIESSQEALHEKVDRIIAAIEEGNSGAKDNEKPTEDECGETVEESGKDSKKQQQTADLQKENEELKAQAARLSRKTLSPLASGLLAKNGMEASAAVELGALEKALASLSLEQRIAVKAELARVGLIA